MKPLTEEQIATFIRRGQEESATWGVPGTAGRFSLAGQQSKMALSRRGGEWYLPTRQHPSTHILKPGLVGFEHSAECEFLTMRLAAAVGLSVAGVELVEVDGLRAVAVTRFDRQVETTGEVSRIHQEDFCQALGVAPARRYESDGGPGVKELGDLVSGSLRAHDSIDAKRRLFDALAFNWLTLGTDAHAKNYSLQHRPGQVSFAPLYDLMSAAPYPTQISPRGRDATLAQRVGGESRFAWVRRRHWERAARDLGRNPLDALERLHQLADSLPNAISRVVAENEEVVGRFADRWGQSVAGWVSEVAPLSDQ